MRANTQHLSFCPSDEAVATNAVGPKLRGAGLSLRYDIQEGIHHRGLSATVQVVATR